MAIKTAIFMGAPEDLRLELESLAVDNEIVGITDTSDKNKYLIVYDDTASASQIAYMIKGAPDKLKSEIDDIISNGESIDFVHLTDFFSHYIAVSRWLF